MKRLILLFILLLSAGAGAGATDITISGLQTIASYRTSDTTAYLRIFSSDTFTTSDGKVVIAGAPGTTGFYTQVTCAAASNVITCPAFTLPSTADSSRPAAGWTGALYDAKGNQKTVLFTKWRLGKTLTSITFKDWEDYNVTTTIKLSESYYTKAQLDLKLAGLSVAALATDGLAGTVKLSAPAADVSNPIALSPTDDLINAEYIASKYSADLGTAVQAIATLVGADDATVVVSKKTATLAASYTIPTNITLRMVGQGKITVAAGQVLTISGGFEAQGNRQRFAGTGTVSFTNNLDSYNPAWFGATNNGSADDDLPELQACVDAVPNGSTIEIPRGFTVSLSNSLDLSGRSGLVLRGGGASVSSYIGPPTTLSWNGAAAGTMIKMFGAHSITIDNLTLQGWGTNANNGAAYGIFDTSDLSKTLTNVSATSGSATITFDGATLVNQLPNGDLIHQGQPLVLRNSSGATVLTTTVSTITTGTSGISTTLQMAAVSPSDITGGTAVLTTPASHNVYVNTSHLFQHLNINFSGATNNLAYRTAIATDLYDGTNSERIQMRDITAYGNGGGSATTSSSYGIGLSFGGYYVSGSVNAVSPLAGYGGGSNVLECDLADIFLYGWSFGIHGAQGHTMARIQGSFMNVGIFGSFNGSATRVRFEGTRQYFHGSGNSTFIETTLASDGFGSSYPRFEISGGSSTFTMIGLGGTVSLSSNGTKTAAATGGTIVRGDIRNVYGYDSSISYLAGTDFTGFQTGQICLGDVGCFGFGTDLFRPGTRDFTALGTPANGVTVYCSDCAANSNPCAASGNGAIAKRLNGAWDCR